MRTLAEKRHNDWHKAIRKRRIINTYGIDYYDNLHQYSKNKIHCSCPMCRNKTRSMQDKRRIEEMEDQILDNQ